MTKNKSKDEILAMFKKALEHKKEWQKQFAETYATPDMKVEFF